MLRGLTAAPMAVGLAARLALAELQRQNIDPAPLLTRCRLSVAGLANDNRISVISQMNFLDAVSKASGDDWIGLTLGGAFDLRELGMLYYVGASSHRLGDALRRLERYVHAGNEALVVRTQQGKVCRIGLTYAGVPRHKDRHQMEFFAVALIRLCRQFVGQKITPRAVSFVHHRSGDMRRVASLFGCAVQFGADTDEISFEADVTELPLVGADPFLNELMLKNCEDAIVVRTSNVSPFRTVVENIIAPLLPHAEAQAKTVAMRLGLSERTFARRLAAEGLSFGEILDDMRRDLATHYLEEPNLQVSQIAWLLGFHQPSAFSHACRRWTGKSPSQYRRGRTTAFVST
jgi:AraC-like DNA-binding protein